MVGLGGLGLINHQASIRFRWIFTEYLKDLLIILTSSGRHLLRQHVNSKRMASPQGCGYLVQGMLHMLQADHQRVNYAG